MSLLSQTIHVTPFEQAAGLVGARYSSADATPFDAFRTASLVRQLSPAVVLGVDAAVLDGLAELERPLDEVFAPVRTVVTADADAFARLTEAGLAPCSLGQARSDQRVCSRSTTTRCSTTRPAGTSTSIRRRASCCSPTSSTASPPATASGPASAATLIAPGRFTLH